MHLCAGWGNTVGSTAHLQGFHYYEADQTVRKSTKYSISPVQLDHLKGRLERSTEISQHHPDSSSCERPIWRCGCGCGDALAGESVTILDDPLHDPQTRNVVPFKLRHGSCIQRAHVAARPPGLRCNTIDIHASRRTRTRTMNCNSACLIIHTRRSVRRQPRSHTSKW